MSSLSQNIYRALFVLVCLFFWAAPPVAGQVLYGSLVGNVTDSTGAATPGVKVSIKEAGTNLAREAVANEAGYYSFSTLPAGRYEMQVAREGFKNFTQSGIEISINTTARVDVALQVGPVSETVQISAAPPALQTDRSEVRAELGAHQLRDLPIPPGRNYQALFKLIPGMSPPNNVNTVVADPSRSLVFNTNGASRSSNNFRIDGSGVNAVWLPHNAGYTPTLEAIETVNVVTNSFDAEQGLAGGSASNVSIKSGTNSIHGSAFEFNNNNATKAKPFILPAGQRKPKSIFNQFGGTIGGPILRDKLFYFGSYEGTTDRQTATTFATVPTAAMRRGDLSASPTLIYDPATGAADGSGRTAFTDKQIPAARIDPIALRLLGRLPQPNIADVLTNNYFASSPFTVNRHKMDSKVNWTASNNFSLFGRFSFLKYNLATDGVLGELEGPPAVGAAGSAGKGFGRTYNVAVGGTYLLSSNFIIDANFGYTLQKTNQEQPNLDKNIGRDELGIPGTNGTRRFEGGWPRFVITNYTTIGHSTANRPIIWSDPRFQYTANATWTRGSHNFRFGTDLSRQHLNHTQPEFVGQLHGASGGFTFSGGVTTLRGGPSTNQFNSIAAFLLGLPNSLGRTLQVPDTYTTRATTYSLYARDQWQATRKLTVSYGTRWEYFPIPTREDRGLERYDPVTNKMLICGVGSVPADCGVEQSKKLFAPRLGLAYRATDTFVLRAGYGISIDPYSLARPMRTNFPVLVVLNVTGPNAFQAAGSLRTGIPAITPPNLSNGVIDIPGNVAANTLADKLPRGYIQSWNLTLQKEVGAGFVAQAAYVATRQIRQLGFLDINGGRPGGGAASQPLNQRFGRTATTPLVTSIGNTHYDALQLSVERRFRQGLQVQSSYTLA
ncbi:MAG: TonB-dependent receptor domain-containing protein, partial [Blastocatellia bacterium]